MRWKLVSLVASVAAFAVALAPVAVSAGVTIVEYPAPTPESEPQMVTAGPDGNLWYTEYPEDRIAKVTAGGVFTEFNIPVTSFGDIAGIAVGPDGNLWFTVNFDGRIGKVTTGGSFTMFDIPATFPLPWGIVAGPDGNLWFTETFTDNIGVVTTGGSFTEYPIPTAGGSPFEITSGPDGNLWFTEYGKIGKITTGGIVTEYTVPTANSSPGGIVTGPDGNLWFTDTGGIGKVTTGGAITTYANPSGRTAFWGITAGPDGNLWMAEGKRIARVTTGGSFREYLLPRGIYGDDITVGPDGNLWLGGAFGNGATKVIDLGDPVCPPVPSGTCYQAAKSSLVLNDHLDLARRKFTWRWTRGTVPLVQGNFGDPVSGPTTYTLCVYDHTAGTPLYKIGATIPADPCSTGACWRSVGSATWAYKDKYGNRDGIDKIVLRAGGMPRIQVRGRGVSLLVPAAFSGTEFFDQDPAVIVQLYSSSPASCWSSTFSASGTRKNTVTEFRAANP